MYSIQTATIRQIYNDEQSIKRYARQWRES